MQDMHVTIMNLGRTMRGAKAQEHLSISRVAKIPLILDVEGAGVAEMSAVPLSRKCGKTCSMLTAPYTSPQALI
jgi:hypothetical protein